MAWQDELVTSLRILIGDMGSPPQYSNDRLESVLAMAANIVQQDAVLPNSYTVTINTACISPDPIVNNDLVFANFILLKAACFVDQWTYRSAALIEGVKVTAGPTNISTVGRAGAFKTILDVGPCKLYEDAIKDYNFGSGQQIRAVLSPFISNEFDPDDLLNNYSKDPRYRR